MTAPPSRDLAAAREAGAAAETALFDLCNQVLDADRTLVVAAPINNSVSAA